MKRPDRSSVRQWLVIIGVLALISFVLYQVKMQEARVDSLHAALSAEQEAAEDRGETPVAPSPDELIEDPDAQGPPGPPGPPPTDEAVYAAVESYFLEHPVRDGETPSPAAIAAAVSNYLQEHPPERGEPGPPPSAQQVANAVQAYLEANPPPPGPPGRDGSDGTDGRDGKDGTDGEDGEDASPEQIAAAVEAYIEEHGLPNCPPTAPAEPITVLTTGVPVEIIACVIQELVLSEFQAEPFAGFGDDRLRDRERVVL